MTNEDPIAFAQARAISAAIETAAKEAGIVDVDVARLIPRDGITVDENFYVSGVPAVVQKFKADKPGLFSGEANAFHEKLEPEFDEPSEDYMNRLWNAKQEAFERSKKSFGRDEQAERDKYAAEQAVNKAKDNFVRYEDPRRTKPVFTTGENGFKKLVTSAGPMFKEPGSSRVTAAPVKVANQPVKTNEFGHKIAEPPKVADEFKYGTSDYEEKKRQFIRGR